MRSLPRLVERLCLVAADQLTLVPAQAQRGQCLGLVGIAFEQLEPVESRLLRQASLLLTPAGHRQMGHFRRHLFEAASLHFPIPLQQRVLGSSLFRIRHRQPAAPLTDVAGLPASGFTFRRRLQGLLQQLTTSGVVALQLGLQSLTDQPISSGIPRAGSAGGG